MGEKERWIDVQAGKGLLIAYEGPRPVWATLCSAPLAGRGVFVVAGKHHTRTLGEGAKAEAHLPHVQRLTGALWLAGDPSLPTLGQPAPGDVVRVSPADASYLFSFTSPTVPEGFWSFDQGGGTKVQIRD